MTAVDRNIMAGPFPGRIINFLIDKRVKLDIFYIKELITRNRRPVRPTRCGVVPVMDSRIQAATVRSSSPDGESGERRRRTSRIIRDSL